VKGAEVQRVLGPDDNHPDHPSIDDFFELVKADLGQACMHAFI